MVVVVLVVVEDEEEAERRNIRRSVCSFSFRFRNGSGCETKRSEDAAIRKGVTDSERAVQGDVKQTRHTQNVKS